MLFQSLQFPDRKRMFGLWSHVCCLRNYKYTPRHFQVKGWGNANTQTQLAREKEYGREGGREGGVMQPNKNLLSLTMVL